MAAPKNPHRPAKLTADQVRQIRINRNGQTAKQLATGYGVHWRTVEKIRAFETWVNVRIDG